MSDILISNNIKVTRDVSEAQETVKVSNTVINCNIHLKHIDENLTSEIILENSKFVKNLSFNTLIRVKKYLVIIWFKYKRLNMTKSVLLDYLRKVKDEFRQKYGIVSLGLYGSYARDEATNESDVDIFYERDETFELSSGLELMNIDEKIAQDLNVAKVDFVALEFMNPIVKYYAKKDFIYV